MHFDVRASSLQAWYGLLQSLDKRRSLGMALLTRHHQSLTLMAPVRSMLQLPVSILCCLDGGCFSGLHRACYFSYCFAVSSRFGFVFIGYLQIKTVRQYP